MEIKEKSIKKIPEAKGKMLYTCNEVDENGDASCVKCGWKCWKDEKR